VLGGVLGQDADRAVLANLDGANQEPGSFSAA
jgi:hypothetical protein